MSMMSSLFLLKNSNRVELVQVAELPKREKEFSVGKWGDENSGSIKAK